MFEKHNYYILLLIYSIHVKFTITIHNYNYVYTIQQWLNDMLLDCRQKNIIK